MFAGLKRTANGRAAAGFHSCTFILFYVKEPKIKLLVYFHFSSQTHLPCCHLIPQSLMQAAGYSEPWSSNSKDNPRNSLIKKAWICPFPRNYNGFFPLVWCFPLSICVMRGKMLTAQFKGNILSYFKQYFFF